MEKKQKDIFIKFIIGYGIVCFVCLLLVAEKCAGNTNWMSYLGSYLGGILGGLATLIAIYFTLESIKQDNMVYIIPLKTTLYGYYEKNCGCFVTTENIDTDSSLQKQFWNIQEQIILQLVCVENGDLEKRLS